MNIYKNRGHLPILYVYIGYRIQCLKKDCGKSITGGFYQMKKRWVQRGMAWILIAVLLLTGQQSLWAWEVQKGQKCGSVYGDIYVGSDGKPYYSQQTEKYLIYNKDGSIRKETLPAGYARQWFYMINTKGEMEKVFCIEAGVDFKESEAGYTVDSGLDTAYGKRLPETARKGIALTLLFGWKKGCSLPVSGINMDDYAVATQILLWEYQQQLRIDAGARRSNGWAGADQFYKNLKDRPAEKAYNWILQQIQQHVQIPSFTAETLPEADTYTMKYNPETGKYSITLQDTNHTKADLKWEGNTNITVSRKGEQYTLTTAKAFNSTVTLKLQKQTLQKESGIFIWGMPGYQTMASGCEDALHFYMKLKTEEDGGLRIVKKAEDGQVNGVSFKIEGNGKSLTAATAKDGTVQVQNLIPGTYVVTEIQKDQYIPIDSQKVTIKSGVTTDVEFYNKMKRGTLKVIKTAEDGNVKDVAFRLFGTSAYGTAIDVTVHTDKTGCAVFKDLPISGEEPYTLEETGVSEQYIKPDPQKITIRWNQETNASFHNIVKKFQLHVKKQDSQMLIPQGDASLAGAQYGLYKDGELVDVYTTDAEGCFTTSRYLCGKDWTLQELKPSPGYRLDTMVYKIAAAPGNHELETNEIYMEVKENVICGQIQILKMMETNTVDGSEETEKPEANAEFQVFLQHAGSYENARETERAVLITDENGYARSTALPYGCYIVKQIQGKEGYTMAPTFSVDIAEADAVYSYNLTNKVMKSRIRIEKRDFETGELITAAAAGFQILDAQGQVLNMQVQDEESETINTFYTNQEGWLMLPRELPYGEYQLVEVQAPQGYLLDAEPIAFRVDGSQEEIVIVKQDRVQKGKIKIEKRGEVFASVTESDSVYQPLFRVQGLQGVEFTITAAEDIYTGDGTLRVKKDTEVAVITTDEAGMCETQTLYLGKYRIVETKTPEGYMAQEPMEVELSAESPETETTLYPVTVMNERQRLKIYLNKEMEIDENSGRGTMNEILNVHFGLYAGEDLYAEDGQLIRRGALIEIAPCRSDGVVEFKTDLPSGTYVVRETVTHEAYELDTEEYTIAVRYNPEDPVEVRLNLTPEAPIHNELLRGDIVGKKVDDTGTPLANAWMGLFELGQKEFTEQTALFLTMSDINGRFCFPGMPYGRYIVKELEAPNGYVLDDDVYIVDVDDTPEHAQVHIVNDYITGTLQITKKDIATGEPIANCGFEILDWNGKKLLQDITDENGYAEFSLGYGMYYYREYDAPKGYLIDEKAHPFSILENGKIVKAEVTNRMIEGLLLVEKIDGETGRPLAQCGIEILDMEGNIIQRQYTDEEGIAMFELPYGEYYYREFEAPEGYEKDVTARSFRIEEDECVLTRAMENFKEKEVPHTGDALKPLLPWLAGTAASAVSLLILGKWKRRFH